MKLPFFISLFLIFLLSNNTVFSQIQPDYSVEEGIDPVTLVQQYLIGQGVATSNITYTGSLNAEGSFSGESNLGISSGVLLTSGKAVNSVGPNNAANKGFDNTASGDPDLNILSGGTTEDASVLEFDFIPQSNMVEFRYVFGSDEYPEYANSAYNDVFGFFISGPGISGGQGFANDAKNIAIAPVLAFPQIYVSINNINNGTSNNGPCENCQFYVNNGTGSTPSANPYIQYDGFTTVMVASSVVVACSTYHIKLVVADIGDGAYDSGVFLEANSFSSVGLGANVGFTHAAVDTAVEACNNAEVAFELFEIASLDYPINLEIGGTAENGVDYEFIEDQIIIPMGDTMVVLPIIPIEDGIYEYITETVTLIFNSSICGVDMDTLTVYVKDYPILGSVASGDQNMVCGEVRKLQATGYGGIPPYYYQWDTGETTDTLDVSPMVTTTYTVTITDECGSQKVETIEVVVQGPVAYAGEDIPICLNQSTVLTATGGTSWLWQPGNLTDQAITVSPLITTTYTLTVFDACGNSSTDEVTVFVDEPFADAGADEDICLGQPVTLTANDTPGGTWIWTDMTTMATYNGRSITVSPPDSRQYCVEVTDNCGNTLTDCLFVNIFQLTAIAGPDQVITYGTPTTLHGSVLQGAGPFQYQWEPSDKLVSAIVQNPTTMNLYESTIFTLYVTDLGTGCVSEQPDSVTVSLDGYAVIAHPAAQPDTICSGSLATLFTMPDGGTNNYTFQWTSNPPGFTSSLANPEVSPSNTTVYTVTVNDGYNTANAVVTVIVNQPPQVNLLPANNPRVEIISPTEIGICVFDTVNLDAGNPGSAYFWSNGSNDQTISIQTSGLSFDFQEFDVSVINPETGCIGTANIVAYFTFQNCSYGIEDNASNKGLMAYPNPSGDGLFNFQIEGLEGEILLEVFNSQGIISFKQTISVAPENTFNSSLNLSQNTPGIYFLKLTYDGGTMLRKLIIQK
ncbi:MAG: hypothetical protein FD166_84 [Bacteroidetes bacterium]|nr:MAG: hypothetical protein FD166_84 [Bacteroidota bacterium]